MPEDALLRNPGDELVAKYEAAADQAWPLAKEAIVKLSGDQIRAVMDTPEARSMILSTMAPMLAAKVKPDSCPTINRIFTDLAPLPPHNMASLLVAFAQLAQKDSGARHEEDAGSPLDLCPLAG